jgi:Flp pilus assembly protein TadG
MKSLQALRNVFVCDRGTSLVEFALVLPLLAFLIIAMVDFGRGMAISMTLESAARSGAEYGGLFPQDTAGITTAIAEALGPGLTSDAVSALPQCRCAGAVVDCSAVCNGGGAEIYLTVRVDYAYSPILPYPGIASSYPLTGTAEFRVR